MRVRSLIFFPARAFSFFASLLLCLFCLTIQLAEKWLSLVDIRVAVKKKIPLPRFLLATVGDEVRVPRGFPTHLRASCKWLRKSSEWEPPDLR